MELGLSTEHSSLHEGTRAISQCEETVTGLSTITRPLEAGGEKANSVPLHNTDNGQKTHLKGNQRPW
jgi:hypothetical protein